jgi:Ca2+-transporting ATPase
VTCEYGPSAGGPTLERVRLGDPPENNDSAAGAEGEPHVRHAAVPGRVRLGVTGLRRSEALRAVLEERVSRVPCVRGVSASARTGTVLVHFDPARPLQEILDAVRDARAHGPVANPAAQTWHALSRRKVARRLGTRRSKGLKPREARRRLQRFGANRLPRAARRSEVALLVEQLSSAPIALLAVSGAISLASGGLADALAITAVALATALIGFFTERGTQRTIRALDAGRAPAVAVVRKSRVRALDPEAVVPGDLLLLRPGSYVAADARLIRARRLQVVEAMLTGESQPAEKRAKLRLEPDAPLAERANMVHAGTTVTGGAGSALAVGTGAGTEMARVQRLALAEPSPSSPLELQLDALGRRLALVSAAACTAAFALGALRGKPLLELLRAAIALGVAAVPESFPAIRTSTLARGVRGARRRGILVRELPAIEALGAVDVVCLDKTGTLTRNEMSVAALQLGCELFELRDGALAADAVDPVGLRRLLTSAVLCSEDALEDGSPAGSSTERAIAACAQRHGVDAAAARRDWPVVELEQRGAGRRYVLARHERGGRSLVTAKGSPEQLLALCDSLWLDGVRRPLTDAWRRDIERANEVLAGRAMRVLGVACSEGRSKHDADGLGWLGLIGISDPVRPDAAGMIAELHHAGIRTLMITGDQRPTAVAVARALGLHAREPLRVADAADPDALARVAGDGPAHVVCRAAPAHKLALVRQLQARGYTVAMTGDGVNDAPALKAADVGIAMGAGESEFVRGIADVVLERNELAAVIDAVRAGRTIHDNVRRPLRFLLATNASEILVTLGGLASGCGVPLNAMQLLWINLVTDVLPGLALASEEEEPDVLARPPRDPRRPVLGREELSTAGAEATALALGSLAAWGAGLARHGSGNRAGALAFHSLSLSQLMQALAYRSANPLRRSPTPLMVAGTLAVHALALRFPLVRRLLRLPALSAFDLCAIAAGAGVPALWNLARGRAPKVVPALPANARLEP